MSTHVGETISIYQISGLITIAWEATKNSNYGINGFRECGIWPLNRNVFTDEDFLPSSTTDQSANASLDQKDVDHPEPIIDQVTETTNDIEIGPPIDFSTHSNTISTGNDNVTIFDGMVDVIVDPNANANVSPDQESCVNPNETETDQTENTVSKEDIPISEFTPTMKIQRQRVCKSNGQRSQLFTSLPFKNNLQEKEDKKKENCGKKIKNKKRLKKLC